jgi:hypothetical protein
MPRLSKGPLRVRPGRKTLTRTGGQP